MASRFAAPPSLPARPFWSAPRVLMVGGALALPAVLLALTASACSVQNDLTGAAGAGGAGSGAGPSATGAGGTDADATVPDAQPDVEEPTFAELCGKGPCSPGLPDGCSAAGSAAKGSDGAGADGSAEDGLLRGAPALVGCQVALGDDGEPRSICAAAGPGTSDAPCQDASDCRPGHACIPTEASSNDTTTGLCRQYCCADLESCPPDAYCAPRSLVDEPGLKVPVCVALTPCELLEAGSCPVGTSCGVVRESGATSCVVPGKGTLCEPCDCAEGFVCAAHTGLCQRLCRTDGSGDACGTGFCQGGSAGYPTGFGVCVGGDQVCD